MAQNKKNHHVPQLYLRRFSCDGKRINLYNLRSGRVVYGAPLKSQCYRNYFYGRDSEVEHALAEIESEAGALFKLIDQTRCLPPRCSRGHLTMLLFMLMQRARTPYAIETNNEIADKLVERALRISAVEAFGPHRVGDAASRSLAMATRLYPMLVDMHYKLVHNLSSEQLVTSDNPVVFYNQFFAFRRQLGTVGIACKGLQIFFPVDPEKLILLYDSKVYGVGSASREAVEVTDPRDIYELNVLQMCSACENVYFMDPDIDIDALRKKAAPFLRTRKTNVMVFTPLETQRQRQELVAASKEEIRTNLSLSFVRVRKSARRWRDSFRKQRAQPAVVLRDGELFDRCMQLFR